jgi:methionyl-tRNA formyltransferase
LKNIILFTDGSLNISLLELLGDNLKLIVGASIRPESHKFLEKISQKNGVRFLIHPKKTNKNFKNFVYELKNLKPDLYFINSYSMILNRELLNIPKKGGLNVHFAYLPKNRGSNPIQWAIINKDKFAGVTLHEVDESIDTGAIVAQKKTLININDTWVSINERLQSLTNELIQQNLESIINNRWTSRLQEDGKANYNRRRKPEDGLIEWSKPTINIYNLVRALIYPLPGAYFFKNQKKIIIDYFLTLNEVFLLKYQNNKSAFKIASDFSIMPVKSSSSNKFKSNIFFFKIRKIDSEFGIFKIYNINWLKKSMKYDIRIDSDESLELLKPHLEKFIKKELNLIHKD